MTEQQEGAAPAAGTEFTPEESAKIAAYVAMSGSIVEAIDRTSLATTMSLLAMIVAEQSAYTAVPRQAREAFVDILNQYGVEVDDEVAKRALAAAPAAEAKTDG